MNPLLEEIKKEVDQEGEKVVRDFQEKIIGLRTNRPEPRLVEFLLVECYGQKIPLRELSSINIKMPNQLIIQVWDRNILPAIEEAIKKSSLNLNPQKEENLIRLVFPPLSKERREELRKILERMEEEAKIVLRNLRKEIKKKAEELAREGKISEDENFAFKERLQKIIDKFSQEIEERKKIKEEEIMNQ